MARRWVIVVVAVPLALVAVAAGAAWSFDANSQKARLVEAVRRATGRELVVAGPIRLGWSLTPTLEAQDVSLANMQGGSRPVMATAARIEARLRLWPLLAHRVELARVTLVRPDILLETNADGVGNWQFQRPAVPAVPADPGVATPGTHTTTVLNTLAVEDGRVVWRDGETGRTGEATVSRATLDGGEGPLHLVAQAQSAGMAMSLDATLGTFRQVRGQDPAPFPVRLRATLGDATLSLDGMADPASRSLSGQWDAAVPDPARLAQRPGWPPLRDVHLAMAWTSGQGGSVKAEGTLAGAPWRFATNLLPTPGGVALRGLALASSAGDLAGDAALRLAPRPELRGTLVSRQLDLDAIPALIPGRPQAAPVAPGAAPAPAAAASPEPARIFSDAPLPWAVLRLADADLQLSVGTVHAGGADYRNATAHLALQDGVLRLDPVAVQAPEGRIDGSASADARQAAPPVALTLRSGAFALQPLAQAIGLPGASEGTAQLDVALRAAGLSPHALAASLDGHVGIALVDGEVANAALVGALGDLARSANVRLEGDGRSHVRCLAIRADASAGQVTLAALQLDTSRLLLEGGGTLDLGNETMALRLRPLLRLGGAGVSAPIRLDGPIRRPTVTMDPGQTGRVGLVIGAPGPPDGCPAALTAARDGRQGPLPAAAVPGKGGKPADLLRSLLR